MENTVQYKHPNLLDHGMKTEDSRPGASYDDTNSISLYEGIPHSQYPSRQNITPPDMYTDLIVSPEPYSSVLAPAASTDPASLHEDTIQLATSAPPHRTSPHDMTIIMATHSFSPTRTTVTPKMDKPRDPHMKVHIKACAEKCAYYVHNQFQKTAPARKCETAPASVPYSLPCCLPLRSCQDEVSGQSQVRARMQSPVRARMQSLVRAIPSITCVPQFGQDVTAPTSKDMTAPTSKCEEIPPSKCET